MRHFRGVEVPGLKIYFIGAEAPVKNGAEALVKKEEYHVSVRIRMKKLGRRHRPFYRICVMDQRAPRNGRAIEEIGTYDPMVGDLDARAILDKERITYWLSVGAQPSDKVGVLIKKYGPEGTHIAEQEAALARLEVERGSSAAPTAVAEAPAEEAPATEVPATEAPAEEASADAPAEESK